MTEQLRTRLRQAADGHASTILVPDLVQRARAAKRRQRYAAGGAAVLVAAVLVGGGLAARAVLPEQTDGHQPAKSPSGSASATSATETKWQVLGLEEGQRVVDEDFRTIREILDPDGTHLADDQYEWDGILSGADDEGETAHALPVGLAWRSAGASDPTPVQVTIATAWRGIPAGCQGNSCRDVELPGGVRAKAIGDWAYAHEQADGTVVQIHSADEGPEATPLEDLGISQEQIAELLTSEELAVPSKRVPIVPGMPVDDARRILLEALGDDAETYQHESGTDDDGTTLKGTITGGDVLTVDLDKMTEDVPVIEECAPYQTECEVRTVNGRTVLVTSIMNQDPSNFQMVTVQGDQQQVHLYYELPAGGQGPLTLDQLVDIAADDRWQQ